MRYLPPTLNEQQLFYKQRNEKKTVIEINDYILNPSSDGDPKKGFRFKALNCYLLSKYFY